MFDGLRGLHPVLGCRATCFARAHRQTHSTFYHPEIPAANGAIIFRLTTASYSTMLCISVM